MAYVPTVWENDITEVDEDNMNHIEDGIKNNDDKLQGITSMGSIVVDSIRSKNIFNENWALGSINVSNGSINPDNASTSIVSANLIPVKPNTTYIISFSGGNYTIDRIAYFNSSGTFISRSDSLGITTFTTDANTYFIRFNIWLSGITPSAVGNTQLEVGTTATSYSSYQGLGYESGSNANGKYIKYDDGTLIQWGKRTSQNVACTTTWGAFYRSDWQSGILFPIEFVEVQMCEVYFLAGTYASFIIMETGPQKTATQPYYIARITSSTLANVEVGFYAIGRWY